MKLKELNLINVFLCLSVVAIHLTASPVTNLRHDSLWYFIMFFLNKILTFAVPGFIFLSGFKLHNKFKTKNLNIRKFYMQRLKKIILPYFISYNVYFIYYLLHSYAGWNIYFKGLLLGTLVAHFYYIIIAIQLYLLFPLINSFFKKYDKLVLALSFVSTVLFNQFISFQYADRFFGTYIFYFIFGMYASHHFTSKKFAYRKMWLVLFIPISLAHILLCYKMSLGEYCYKFSGIGQIIYNITFLIMIYNLSICLKTNKYIEKVANFINPHTFNIFLYHIFIINILQISIYPHFSLTEKTTFALNSIVVGLSITLYCLVMNKSKLCTK